MRKTKTKIGKNQCLRHSGNYKQMNPQFRLDQSKRLKYITLREKANEYKKVV